MYERTFGRDWTRLDRDEAIERAFALGVAAACGREDREELARIVRALPGSYDRSIVELAYDEGRTKARRLEVTDADDVWNALVDDEDRALRVAPLPEAMPAAIGRLSLLERDEGPPSSLGLPGFLRK